MPTPIASTDRQKNQCSIDDFPNQSYAPSPPAKPASPGKPAAFEGGYTGADGSTGVSRDAVNQLVAGAPKKPAPPPPPPTSGPPVTNGRRSPADCGYPAFKTTMICAGGLAGAAAATTTVVGAFVAGAAAGVACADAYGAYTDCLEGKKK